MTDWRWESFKEPGREGPESELSLLSVAQSCFQGSHRLSLLVSVGGRNDLLVKSLPLHPYLGLCPPAAAWASGLLLSLSSRPLAQPSSLLLQVSQSRGKYEFFLQAVLEF